MRIEIELASMRNRVYVEISGMLLVHGEILKMDVRFDRRQLRSFRWLAP